MENPTNFKSLLNPSDKNVIEATYKEMGKRAEKAVAFHILRENLQEENLINNVSNVNYLKDNEGRTTLKQIPNLDIFVDDIYVYGYLRNEDIVYDKKGRVVCTQGENGAASCIIENLRSISKQTISKNSLLPHINIMFTFRLCGEEVERGNTLKTIRLIERKKKVYDSWKKRTLQEAKAAFVAKIDVSNISLLDLQDNIKEMEQNLFVLGFFIFSVDYTQDFSGTINKEELIDYLIEKEGFCREGEDKNLGEEEDKKIILNNDKSVGKNVLTYLRIEEEKTFRIKFYNKFVCNLEAGYVRAHFGGHVFDSVCSTSKRLRNLFYNREVRERGVTRIEISVYGEQKRVNTNLGKYLIEREYKLLNSNKELFFIQPTHKQWLALAEVIDKCFILVDKPNTTIYVLWYGNLETGRLVGVKIDYSKVVDKDNIDNIILWAVSDFGFRLVPIYVSEIIEYKKDSVLFSPLKCFVKGKDTKTRLVQCNFPRKINNEASNININEFLPPTRFLEWEFRIKKLPSYKDVKPIYDILECPELVKDKAISFLDVISRHKRNLELEEQKNKTIWIRETEEKLNKKSKYLEYIYLKLKEKEKLKELTEKSFCFVKDKFLDVKGRNILEEDVGAYFLYGWRSFGNSFLVFLKDIKKEEFKVLIANLRLRKILNLLGPYFNEKEVVKHKTIYFYKPLISEEGNNFFRIIIGNKRSILSNNIDYFPITMDKNINSFLSEEIGKIINEEKKLIRETENKFITYIEPKKDITKTSSKCLDIEEGEFFIIAYSRIIFKNKQKTFILVRRINSNINFYVQGYWIEEEIKKIEKEQKLNTIPLPVPCRLGKIKTTPSKKKARTCTICHK